VTRELPRDRRALLVVCLLFVTMFAQSSALSSEHQQHHSSDHCCLLCHVGPMPLLQTSVSVTVTPVFVVQWIAFSPDFESGHDALLAPSSSRAPPAA
jgi:hypothetical protein